MTPMARAGEAGGALERARDAYAARAWGDAYALLQRADELESLAPADLGLLATAAYMLGRDEEWVAAHERAHHLHLEAGEVEPAARSAFWIGISLALRDELGPAEGWFGRAQRLLDERDADCVERGFLMIPYGLGLLEAGESAAAEATAADAAAAARKFANRDLFALAMLLQGQAAADDARVNEGLTLLDEAMVAVTTEDLSPIVCGLVVLRRHPHVPAGLRASPRAGVDAGARLWWQQQPDMVAFTGRCLVHRAEILQLGGAWRTRARGGPPRVPALRRDEQPDSGSRPLPRGRPAAAPGRSGGRGGDISRREPRREGAPAGPCTAPARAGASRRGGGRHPAGRGGARRSLRRRRAAARLRRDHARGRRLDEARAACDELETSPGGTRARCSTRSSRTSAAPSSWRQAMRRALSSSCAARWRLGGRSTFPTRSRGPEC